MKKLLTFTLLYMISATLILTGETSLDYLEGVLEMKDGSSWEELYIGDDIPANAMIRLSYDGYAEILVDNSLITLMNDGNYNMRELTGSVSGLSGTGLDLKKKLTLNTEYEKWQQEATMGVRGAEQSTLDMSTGMEDAFTYLNAGLELLAEDEYEDALVNFSEGWKFFEDENCLLFAAVCYDALGKKGDYARSLREISGDYIDDEFLTTFGLRKGELLLRSLAYDDALEVLEKAIESPSATAEDLQKIQYLLGQGYLGSGSKGQARKAFEASRSMNPSSDTGKMAGDALKAL